MRLPPQSPHRTVSSPAAWRARRSALAPDTSVPPLGPAAALCYAPARGKPSVSFLCDFSQLVEWKTHPWGEELQGLGPDRKVPNRSRALAPSIRHEGHGPVWGTRGLFKHSRKHRTGHELHVTQNAHGPVRGTRAGGRERAGDLKGGRQPDTEGRHWRQDVPWPERPRHAEGACAACSAEGANPSPDAAEHAAGKGTVQRTRTLALAEITPRPGPDPRPEALPFGSSP